MRLGPLKLILNKRVFPLLLAAYLVATQLLSVLHQHQPLDANQGEICLECLVLQQVSSALPAPSLSFFQPVSWLILPFVVALDSLHEIQVTAPVARGPPSEVV